MKNGLVSKLVETDRLKIYLAAAVLVFSFVIYNATKAPTLSFWDCGEFIACSYTLGIPHPPGTPLYVLIGRIFSIIPFHADISARVNMLSAVTGAIAAMFAFLITFRMIRFWWSDEEFNGWKKTAAYIGSIVGAMMFAFSRTHWNNTMEAEVYTPAMMLLTIIIWLLLRWIDCRHQPGSQRYLLGITFLAFLSIGIHMTTFLFLPAVFLVVILYSEELRKDYRFYITGLCLFLISYSLDLFIWASAIWGVVLLVGVVATRQRLWVFSLALFLAAIVGLSCQLYTPIRSAQKPSINQNNPSSSVAVFKSFLERKQYGQELMINRAMDRRGQLKNQFGTFQRMGFWGFFHNQYGINGRWFSLLFVLGLLGVFEFARRKPKIGLPYLLMIVLGTVFLVWYMNFADGTLQDPITGDGHIEVRDRDYFFTPGFILFGIAIGMGVAGLMEMARESLVGRLKKFQTGLMCLMSLLIFLSAVPIKANYFVCDRSRNYVPYDFAFNMLSSCDPNAILFNGGDNDTFPIWCLQEVYGIRPDVTAINLALSNTSWYTKQTRDYRGVPLRWTDAQIDNLRHRMTPDGRRVRIQDQVLDEILNVNAWQRPICFSFTMAGDSRRYRGRSLENNLVMQGMVYKLHRGERPGKIDLEANHDLYWNRFQYRSLDDATVYKNDRTMALSGNYTTGLVLAADSLRKAGRYDEAIAETKKAIEIAPFEYASFNFLTQIYVDAGRDSLIPALLEQVPPDRVKDIYYIWGAANRHKGNRAEAKRIIKNTLELYPDFEDAFKEYCRLLFEDKEMDKMRQAVNDWLLNNPDDAQAKRLLEELLKPLAPPPASSDSN